MKKQKKDKLNIYIHVAENSGVGFYRQYLPAIMMREHGLAEVLINDFRWGEGNHVEPTEKVFFETCNWADVVLVGRMDRPEYYAKFGAAREYFNIPIVMDTDDNVHNVRPTNPGYQGYFPGAEAQYWNTYAMKKVFDAITVTTQDLKEFYVKHHPRIYVLPNSIDMKEWDSFERKSDGRIKMTFMCSGAHSEGFGIIMDSVYKILKKYPQVDFYFQDMYWRLFSNAPEDIKGQLKNIPWIKLKDWPKTMKEYGFDIGLAPLRDNYFNRGKSNLRYLEFSAAGMATIVSPVSPYKIVKHGVDGLVAKEKDDWYNGMEKLITDVEFRNKISKAAYKKVKKDFDINKNAKMWETTLREIHDKFHEFYGPKKRFIDWGGKGKYREIKRSYSR